MKPLWRNGHTARGPDARDPGDSQFLCGPMQRGNAQKSGCIFVQPMQPLANVPIGNTLREAKC